MGTAPKIITKKTSDTLTYVKAWDSLNMQVSDCNVDVKNITDFALGVRGNSHLRIIDIGCGAAHHDFLLAQLGHTCIGIDRNNDIISYARSLYPSLELHCGDILANGAQSIGNFDMVICKHLALPKDELKTVLKKANALLRNHEKGLLCFDFLVSDGNPLTKEFTWAETIDTLDVKGIRKSRFALSDGYYAWNEEYDLSTADGYKTKVFNERKLHFIIEAELSSMLKNAGVEVQEKRYENSGIDGMKGVGVYGIVS